jgi:hypothetical protein
LQAMMSALFDSWWPKGIWNSDDGGMFYTTDTRIAFRSGARRWVSKYFKARIAYGNFQCLDIPNLMAMKFWVHPFFAASLDPSPAAGMLEVFRRMLTSPEASEVSSVALCHPFDQLAPQTLGTHGLPPTGGEG